MDNFMASVRGQPADWIREENSLLQSGRSDTSALASGCSGTAVTVPRRSSGMDGCSASWTFALRIYLVCVIVTEGYPASEAGSQSC